MKNRQFIETDTRQTRTQHNTEDEQQDHNQKPGINLGKHILPHIRTIQQTTGVKSNHCCLVYGQLNVLKECYIYYFSFKNNI